MTEHEREREILLSEIGTVAKNSRTPTFLDADKDRVIFHELMEIIFRGDAESLNSKLEEYYDFYIDSQNREFSNFALVHHAASRLQKDCLKILLHFSANPDIKTKSGRSPIHLLTISDCKCETCSAKITQCLQILIEYGADVDIEDDFGETPLYYAARNRLSSPAEFLLSNGANINHWVTHGLSVATLLAQYVPDVLKTEFDKCISNESAHKGGLRLDFSLLLQEVSNMERYGGALSSSMNRTFPSDGLHEQRQTQGKEKKTSKTSDVSSIQSTSSHPTSRTPPKETELLNYLLKADLVAIEAVVNHPLVESFVHLKWLSVRRLFFLLRSVYLLVISLYTFYVFNTFVNRTCFYPAETNLTSLTDSSKIGISAMAMSLRSNETLEKARFGFFIPTSNGGQPWHSFGEYFKAHQMTCEPTLQTQILACLFAVYAILGVMYELFKMFENWYDYFKTPVNLTWWIFNVNVAITSIPGLGLWGHTWLYPYAAFSVTYGWMLVLVQIGRIPHFGILVGVFVTVLKDFTVLLLTFTPVLLAFALGFAVILPQHEFFRSIPLSLFKVFLMMTGDVDFWGVFRETWAVVSIHEHRGYVYIPLFMIYTAYILIVTMVLMSLLLGLAVNDIQEVRREAALKRTVGLIREIGIFESLFQNRVIFLCGCSKFFTRVFSITSLECMNGTKLIVFPQDPENQVLPSKIKQNLVPYLNCCCSDHEEKHCKKLKRPNLHMINRRKRTHKILESETEFLGPPKGSSMKSNEKQTPKTKMEKSKSFKERNYGSTLDSQVEKSREVVYRDLMALHAVQMLLGDNERMKRHLESLKSKLIRGGSVQNS